MAADGKRVNATLAHSLSTSYPENERLHDFIFFAFLEMVMVAQNHGQAMIETYDHLSLPGP